MKQIIFEKAVLFLDNISQKQNFKFIKNILGEKINVILMLVAIKEKQLNLFLNILKLKRFMLSNQMRI